MSQLEWSANPTRKMTKGASPTGSRGLQWKESVPRWANMFPGARQVT